MSWDTRKLRPIDDGKKPFFADLRSSADSSTSPAVSGISSRESSLVNVAPVLERRVRRDQETRSGTSSTVSPSPATVSSASFVADGRVPTRSSFSASTRYSRTSDESANASGRR